MAQVIRLKRRIPGTGGPSGLAAGEPAVSISAVSTAGIANLYVGDGTNTHDLVSAQRQVELAGGQTITGAKTFTTGGLTIAPTILHVTGGTDGQFLSTNGAGALSWENVSGCTVGPTAPASPNDGDLWFDGDTLHVWDGGNWVEIGIQEPTGAGVWGRTQAGAWQLALPLAGGQLTGALTFAGGGSLTIGPTAFHLTGGTAGYLLRTDGAGNVTWIPVPPASAATGTEPTTPNEGDLWFDGDYLYVYDGGTWVHAGFEEPSGAGVWGRTQAGAWQLALPLSGGTLTGALTAPTITVTTALNLAPANLHLSGGTNGQILTTDGAGNVSWSTPEEGGLLTVTANAPLNGNGTSGSPLGVTPATSAQIETGTNNVFPITSLGLRGEMGLEAADLTTTNKTVVPAINELDSAIIALEGEVQALTGALRFVGNYNATTNTVASADAGTLTVGQPLPAASSANEGWFVIVTTAGTGTAPAPTVPMQIGDWIVSTGSAWMHVPLYHTAITAANVAITQINAQTWTNVQQALAGLYTLAGDSLTEVAVDGDSIVGDGTTGDPLAVATVDGGTY